MRTRKSITVALPVLALCAGMVLQGMGVNAAQAAEGPPVLRAVHTAAQGRTGKMTSAWVRIRSLYGDRSQCLDADSNGGGNGTKVQVWTCNGSAQQAWYSTDAGNLINGRFGSMCLDADTNGGGRNGTRLQLWQCNGTAQQRWGVRVNDLALYNELFLNNFNTCVDRDTNTPGNGARAQLWQKDFQPQQWWQVDVA